jgi:hypothetical protein
VLIVFSAVGSRPAREVRRPGVLGDRGRSGHQDDARTGGGPAAVTDARAFRDRSDHREDRFAMWTGVVARGMCPPHVFFPFLIDPPAFNAAVEKFLAG